MVRTTVLLVLLSGMFHTEILTMILKPVNTTHPLPKILTTSKPLMRSVAPPAVLSSTTGKPPPPIDVPSVSKMLTTSKPLQGTAPPTIAVTTTPMKSPPPHAPLTTPKTFSVPTVSIGTTQKRHTRIPVEDPASLVTTYKINPDESYFDAVISIHDFTCGPSAFCNKSLSRYPPFAHNCVQCRKCYCDDMCEFYHDCCVDVIAKKFLNNTNKESVKEEETTDKPADRKNINLDELDNKPDNQSGILNNLETTTDETSQLDTTTNNVKIISVQKPKPFRCYNPTVDPCTNPLPSFKIIDTCLTMANDKNELAVKCRQLDKNDFEISLPVSSVKTNMAYKNKYCALCSGELDANLLTWSAVLSCPSAKIIAGLHHYGDIWKTVIKHPKCCVSRVNPPSDVEPRYCVASKNVATCNRGSQIYTVTPPVTKSRSPSNPRMTGLQITSSPFIRRKRDARRSESTTETMIDSNTTENNLTESYETTGLNENNSTTTDIVVSYAETSTKMSEITENITDYTQYNITETTSKKSSNTTPTEPNVSITKHNTLSPIVLTKSTTEQKISKTESLVRHLCSNYDFNVYSADKKKWYQNIFCAYCNRVSLVRNKNKQCSKRISTSGTDFVKPAPKTKTLSVLINFNPKKRKEPATDVPTRQCPVSQILDPTTGDCRELSCPDRMMLRGDDCIRTVAFAKGLTYELRYTLTPQTPVRSHEKDIFKAYRTYVTNKVKKFQTPVILSPLRVVVSGTDTFRVDGIKNWIIEKLDIIANITTPDEAIEIEDFEKEILQTAMLKRWFYNNVLFDVTIFDYCLESNYSRYTTKPTDVSPTKGPEITTATKLGELAEKVHKLSKKQLALLSASPVEASDDITYLPDKWLETCHPNCHPKNEPILYRKNQLKCPHLTYNSTNVTIGNSFVKIDEHKIDVNSSEYDTCDDVVKICADAIQRYTDKNRTVTPDNNDTNKYHGEVIVTIIVTTFSLLGLLLTFLTYCIFCELRSLPGVNTMILVAHLFVAQLFFQSTISMTDNHTLCVIFSLLIHYLWLSSFAWMAVSAYHMFVVFRAKNFNGGPDNKRLFHYAVFANGTPLIIVGICITKNIVISESTNYDLGYAGYSTCFLNTALDIGLFFALPLGLILISNATFFLFTIHAIRAVTSTVRDTIRTDRHHASVYLKLAILLGFSWIFGFLASTFQNVVLSYIFNVTSGLQGVFIFVAYCCSGRVVMMYRKKFCGYRREIGSGKTSGSTYSSNTNSNTCVTST